MSSDPSLTIKDPSEDPSEDPSGEFSWRKILDALSLKMDPATFNLWLRGTRALGLRDGCLTVQVGHANALPWLERRLSRIIERTLAYTLPGVRLRFVAPGDRDEPAACGTLSQASPTMPEVPAHVSEASARVPPAPVHVPPAPGHSPHAPGSMPQPPGHAPDAPGPAPAAPAHTPCPVHPPPSILHRPSCPTGEGSIIVSGEKSVSTLPPLCLCSRQDAPLPLAATSSLARGRPEHWRHRPPRGPPRRLWPGAADLVRQWHVTN
jgi:hypothetical protein